jgi:hypothetical protein
MNRVAKIIININFNKNMHKSFVSTLELKRSIITAKIQQHEVVRDSSLLGGKYILYCINFYTFYNQWTVKKRYSAFVDLHKALTVKINDLPELPPKRFFSMSDDTIKERKIMLEGYLNFIFKNINFCLYTDILEFIEMEKDLLCLLMKNNTMIENTSSTAVKRSYNLRKLDGELTKKSRSVDDHNLNENYYSTFLDYKMEKSSSEKSANLLVIEEFLRNLEYKAENKYDVIKTFESFLKSKKNWPSFKKEEIQKLLYGDTVFVTTAGSFSSESSSLSSKNLKGLLHHVGSIEANSLGAERCLEFLGKLIDYEFNPECDAYIYILKTARIEFLVAMQLNEHLRGGKTNTILICNRILKSILSDDKFINSKLRKILKDDDLIEKFLNWLENDNKI